MRLSGTCGSGIKGWPHCEQRCQRSLHPARTGGSISHKQSDLTLFVSNATSSGRPSRSHTPLQVASFPPANCSIPPFPNSALPRALFQPPPRLLLQPALCLQAQLLALGSPLRKEGRPAKDIHPKGSPSSFPGPVLPQAQSLGKGLGGSFCLEPPRVPGTGSPVSTLRQAPSFTEEKPGAGSEDVGSWGA